MDAPEKGKQTTSPEKTGIMVVRSKGGRGRGDGEEGGENEGTG